MSRDITRYRPCVGAVIFSPRGQVWLGHRYDTPLKHVWQFPQGGRDKNEDPLDALWREMWEEIGLTPKDAKLLDRTERELIYDFPADSPTRQRFDYDGQRQLWFALRLRDHDFPFDFSNENPPEFEAWRWGSFHEAVTEIVPFKRRVYEAVAGRFFHHAVPS